MQFQNGENVVLVVYDGTSKILADQAYYNLSGGVAKKRNTMPVEGTNFSIAVDGGRKEVYLDPQTKEKHYRVVARGIAIRNTILKQ